MSEIWKDVIGYEGLYQVSNFGRVKSLCNDKSRKEKIHKLTNTNKGYLCVNLSKDGKHKRIYVHRLVAMAFLENPLNLETVNHKDENKQNNTVENLEWMSIKDNLNYGTRTERTSKKVLQYTLEGEFIQEWPSTAECGRNGFYQSDISLCCKGKIKSYKGFIWRYK